MTFPQLRRLAGTLASLFLRDFRVATQSFPSFIASASPPHKKVFKGNTPLASGKQSVTLQAANFAVHDVTSLDCDDLIFCLATWAAEGDRL
jgi:hypothetical protein